MQSNHIIPQGSKILLLPYQKKIKKHVDKGGKKKDNGITNKDVMIRMPVFQYLM